MGIPSCHSPHHNRFLNDCGGGNGRNEKRDQDETADASRDHLTRRKSLGDTSLPAGATLVDPGATESDNSVPCCF